jgi:hypothetical protein
MNTQPLFFQRMQKLPPSLADASGVSSHHLMLSLGVLKTVVGYAGGHEENPTYEEVLGEKTGPSWSYSGDVWSNESFLRTTYPDIFFTR